MGSESLECAIVALALIFALAGNPPETCAPSGGAAAELARYDGRAIGKITLEIHGRVQAQALRRHLRLREGERFDAAIWNSDLQQLMNRGVFARLVTRASENNKQLQLALCVDSNWSLLPYIGAQTGAVPILMLGANHANLFGELLEAGGYYMRRGPHNLGRAWLALPNVAGFGSLLDVELVMTGELMNDYPSSLGASGTPDWSVPRQGQEVLRRGLFVDFGYQLIPDWLLLSARYALLFETRYWLNNIAAVFDAANRQQPAIALERGAADKTPLSIISATAIAGRIDLVDNYRYRGNESRLLLATSNKRLGSGRDFSWLYASTRHFIQLSKRFDLAGRATYAHSTGSDRRDQFTLGGYNLEPFVYNKRAPGLLTIRGFRESHFAGRNIAFVNIEPRFVLLHDRKLPLIGDISVTLAAYVDAGHAWQRTDEAFDALYLSAGGGALLSLQNFRYTFLNWYYAHTVRPYVSEVFSVFLTRAFF